MTTTFTLNTTAQALAGGVAATAGSGGQWTLTVGGVYLPGDQITMELTDAATGVQTQIGAGNVTDILPTFCFTFSNKEYVLAGATFYFSSVAQPTVFNDPTQAGNGFVTLSNYYATSENQAAIAPYQGRLIFASRRLVQIWQVDPDPANYALTQTLPNIGTVAPASVQPVGDMDVYMLADNGVRSVRVRDASNNALIADVGTPIDAILQPLLASLTDAQKAAACGIVDPGSNRYWCYIPNADGSAGLIYVFSYFPSSQIAAWGTYSPTYQAAINAPAANYTAGVVTYTGLTIGSRYAWLPGAHEVSITNGVQVLTSEGAFVATAPTATVTGSGAAVTFTGALSLTTAFVPSKFLIFNGQVWARGKAGGNDILVQYGGSTNLVYDNCGVTAVLPYIDGGTPATDKVFKAIDCAFAGTWQVSASTDYTVKKYKLIYQNTAPSFLYKMIPWSATGTHYSLQLVEAGSTSALFSSALVHQKPGNEK
jgi:hypothetical protein